MLEFIKKVSQRKLVVASLMVFGLIIVGLGLFAAYYQKSLLTRADDGPNDDEQDELGPPAFLDVGFGKDIIDWITSPKPKNPKATVVGSLYFLTNPISFEPQERKPLVVAPLNQTKNWPFNFRAKFYVRARFDLNEEYEENGEHYTDTVDKRFFCTDFFPIETLNNDPIRWSLVLNKTSEEQCQKNTARVAEDLEKGIEVKTFNPKVLVTADDEISKELKTVVVRTMLASNENGKEVWRQALNIPDMIFSSGFVIEFDEGVKQELVERADWSNTIEMKSFLRKPFAGVVEDQGQFRGKSEKFSLLDVLKEKTFRVPLKKRSPEDIRGGSGGSGSGGR